jgi:hypothetical protein
MWQHSQEQARCLFHKELSSFVWWASCPPFKNRQDACSTKSKFFCGVGILPALQEQARCLFHYEE